MAARSIENVPEYSVSELSDAVKAAVEQGFAHVRVRGELGRISRPSSGHVYLDLKDQNAVLGGVIWKGVASRLSIAPEQGMEVVATGRLTTFPGQSKYQIVIDALEPAGAGALMAMFEERKKRLAAEGLFDASRKRPLPFLPATIGVVTSPSGAVIRDILHRVRDRFATRVIVWPTAVQGRGAEAQIAAAVEGFNALQPGGEPPRPDVLIVARGGGSLEDLWCFNEEIVARAVAASTIPVISAVGHETDTTLIDFVADRRAPTPSAAAEMATPIRTELFADLLNKERRMAAAQARAREQRRMRVLAAARGLGRPEDRLGAAWQRLDRAGDRLIGGLRQHAALADRRLAALAGRATPASLQRLAARARDNIARDGDRLRAQARKLLPARAERLAALSQLLRSLSYQGVLERGFALVRTAAGGVVRRASQARDGAAVSLVFADGTREATIAAAPGDGGPKPSSKRAAKSAPKQDTLFD